MKRMSYTTADGEIYNLLESENMLVVRTKKGIPLSKSILSPEAKKLAGKFSVIEFIERADVYILEIKPSVKNLEEIKKQARELLKKEKMLR
ncbi:MAG: hypothetical protein EPN92_13250, partial [Chitinophagaceae bacterium]